MTKENKAYQASIKSWIKTQNGSIASCDMNIRHARERIALDKKSIALELAEKKNKVAQLHDVIETAAKFRG